MKIGQVLRTARKMANLTQVEVAQKCFVVDVVISNYENDKSIPDIDVLCRLCNVLNVTFEELKNGEYIHSQDKVLPPVEFDAQVLASSLKELRVCAGLSQTDAAAQVFVTSQTVSKWETGANMPSFETLCAVADLYAVNITSLVNGLNRETDVLNDTSQKFVYKKRSTRLTKATIALSVFMAVFLIATVVLGVSYANGSRQLTNALNNTTKLEQQVSTITTEKSQTDLQLQDSQNTVTRLQEQLQGLNNLYSDLTATKEELEEKLSQIDYDVCKLTLNTPSGQTETYYVLVGVSTTIVPQDQTEARYWSYYPDGDKKQDSYAVDEFTICPTDKSDITLCALPQKSWVDISKARNDEEVQLYKEVEAELRVIDEKYICDLVKAFSELITYNSISIGTKEPIISRITIRETSEYGTYKSQASYYLNKVIDKIKDVESLQDLREQLEQTSLLCEVLVNHMQAYNEGWITKFLMQNLQTLIETQEFYIENALFPYFDLTVRQLLAVVMSFNNNFYFSQFNEYSDPIKNAYSFEDINLYDEMYQWLMDNDVLQPAE